MTQNSYHLGHYTPAPPGDEVESAGGVFLPVAGYGRLRLLVDQDNGTFKGAMRELTLDRIAHVPTLGRHHLPSTKRITTTFDAPMRVYTAAATIRPHFVRKTLTLHSLRPETGLLQTKARRHVDMKELQSPPTTARSVVTAKASPRHTMESRRIPAPTQTRAQVGATRGQVHRARHRHLLPATNLPRPRPHHRPSHPASGYHRAPHSRRRRGSFQ